MPLGNATIDTWNLKTTSNFLKRYITNRSYPHSRLLNCMVLMLGQSVGGLVSMRLKTSAILFKKADQTRKIRLNHRKKLIELLQSGKPIKVSLLGIRGESRLKHLGRITRTGKATKHPMYQYTIGYIETLLKQDYATSATKTHEQNGQTKLESTLENEVITMSYAKSATTNTIRKYLNLKTAVGFSATDTWLRVAIATW